jgi:hypothetical protein
MKPTILGFEVNDMPEHKMLDRKTLEEKGKEMKDESMESEPGKAMKESPFMEQERQGLKGDEAKAKQLYEEKKGSLSQGMKEGIETPQKDVQQGKAFERDVGKESGWDEKKGQTSKEEGWKDMPNQVRTEAPPSSPERRPGSEWPESPKTGKTYEGSAKEPTFKEDMRSGTGLDERKEKQINEERKSNVPSIPKEGKDEVNDPEKESMGNKTAEKDVPKRKTQP